MRFRDPRISEKYKLKSNEAFLRNKSVSPQFAEVCVILGQFVYPEVKAKVLLPYLTGTKLNVLYLLLMKSSRLNKELSQSYLRNSIRISDLQTECIKPMNAHPFTIG